MEALMTALMVWASAHTGLPMADRLPNVIYKDECVIAEMRHEGASCDDAIKARAIYYPGTMILPDTWEPSDLYDVSVVLHELVHHLQHEAGETATGHCAHVTNEPPAYEAQIAWLDAAGVDPYEVMNTNAFTVAMFGVCMVQ